MTTEVFLTPVKFLDLGCCITGVRQKIIHVAPIDEKWEKHCSGKASMEKNVFFRALPELPKPLPPMTPIRATWSSFFGSRNSRFESQFRTKNTIYTI